MSKGKKRTSKVVPWTNLKTVGASATKIPEHVSLEELKTVKINRKRILIEWCVIALVAILAYMPSFFAPFAFKDDYLVGPFASQALDPHVWQNLLAQAIVAPLSQSYLKVSFLLDLNTFAGEPIWYRFVNVILHIASCVYLYLLAFRIARRFQPVRAESDAEYDALPMKVALYSSLLFAVHPLAIESVGYISGRAGVLTGANCLLAMNLFLLGFWSDRLGPILFGYIGCLACIVMGVTTSPEGLAIPFILLACSFLLRSSKEARRFLNERTGEIVILVALSIALPLTARLHFWNDFGNNFGLAPLSQTSYLASQFKGFLFYYLRCALLPIGLSVEPPYFVAPTFDSPGTIIGALGFVALVALAILKRNELPLAFPLAIILLGYLPSLLIQRGEFGADRRFYIPLSGICLLAGWNYARFCLGRGKSYLVGGVALLAVFAGLGIWRQFDWFSTEKIWQAADRVGSSEHTKAMNALIDVGVEKTADDANKRALELAKNNPDCQLAFLTNGVYARSKGNLADARKTLEKAYKLSNSQKLDRFDQFRTTVLYGKSLLDQGEYQTAYNIAMPLYFAYPMSGPPNSIIGQALLGENHPQDSLLYLNNAYRTDRFNPDYIVPLAKACFATDLPKLVENTYKSTKIFLRFVTTPNIDVAFCFAQAALQVGRPDECVLELTKLLRGKQAKPLTTEQIAKCYYLQGKAYKELGRDKESVEAIKTAIADDPKVAEKLKLGTIKPDQEKTLLESLKADQKAHSKTDQSKPDQKP